MTAKVTVGIQVTADTAGAAAAKVALGQVGAEASKSEKALLAYASTVARAQAASGNAAGSAQTLSSALAQVDRTSKQAIATSTQLANVTKTLNSGFQVLPRTIDGLSGSALSAVTALTGIGSAMALLGKGAELAQLGGQTELVRTRFDSLAVAAHTTGDALLQALRVGSGGEISDLNLQLAANKAQLLGVANSAEQFGVLMSIARDRAQQMGISTTQAFDDLTTGLGRGSKLILDNLGILVNTDKANQAYAASIGKTVSALTDQERKQALINQVLRDGQATIAQTGGAVESAAGTFATLEAASSNAQAAVGRVLATLLQIPAQKAVNILVTVSGNLDILAGAEKQLQDFSERALEGTKGFDEYAAKVKGINDQLAPLGMQIGSLTGAQYNYASSLMATGVSADAAYQKAMQYGDAINLVASAQAAAGGSGGSWADALGTLASRTAEVASQSEYNAVAVEGLAQAFAAGGMSSEQFSAALTALEARHIAAANAATQDALEENRLVIAHGMVAQSAAIVSQAMVDEIAKKQQSAIEAEKLARFQADLANLGGAVAGGMMTAGNAAGQLAQMYGIATNEALKLINAQAALAQAKVNAAALSDQRAGERAPGSSGAAEAAAKEDARLKMIYAKLVTTTRAGGAARASAAGAAATKLESIEQKTGDKIADIVAATQEKMTAITEREAAKQAAALAKLNQSLKTSAADRRASNEADDLDLIGVTDPKEAQKLNDRERAQADARKREEAAAAEARATAAAGDAELAQEQYNAREKQIADQQALDEKYYEKQRELAQDPATQEALKQQYDEATRANEERAQLGIDIAKAESDQKASAVQAEKDAVIAAANEQANQVVSAAERSASGVKAATAGARTAAVANLKAIGDAVSAIPSQKTITISVKQDGSVGASSTGGGSGGNRAAGGGNFVTTGPTSLTVGDNPGGRELVTVTPLSGKGTTSISGGMIKMAGGGVIDAGGGYTTPIAGVPAAGGGGGGGRGAAAGGGKSTQSIKDAVAEQKALVELLSMLINLRDQLNAQVNAQPFRMGLIQGLAKRAAEFVQIVEAQLVPTTKETAEGFKRYVDVAKGAVDILSSVADLRHQLQENANDQPFDMNLIRGLARRAADFVTIMQAKLVPTSEYAAAAMSDYASTVGDTVGILKDVADLRKTLSEGSGTAFDMRLIERLANDAVRITKIVKGTVVPATKAEEEGLSLYADVVASSMSIIKDVSSLTSEMFTDYHSPSDAEITRLARDAQRVAKGFMDAGKIMGKDAAEAGKAYAEGVGAAFSAAKEGMLVMDALNSGDFQLKGGALKQFEKSGLAVLGTMQVLGARAATIPTSDIAALQTITAAISGQAEAMIKLAAVPWGDMPGAAGGLAGSGGAMGAMGGTTTIYNTFQMPSGANYQLIAQEVMRVMNAQIRTRR